MPSEFSYSDKQYNALQQAAYQLASCTDQLFQQIDQQQALDRIIDKIRSSSELDTLFKTTAVEVRQLLNADRVGVFRFDPDSGYDDGEFVSEDVVVNLPSALKARVHDHCFGSQFATYYTQGRIQAVSDIYQEGLSDCHIQILEAFKVRANLVVPILKSEELWGLLCIHQCNAPRRWQLAEIEFVRKIADHFAVALQQSEYLEQIRHQATLLAEAQAQRKALMRQKALVKLTQHIRQPAGWELISQTATEELRHLLEVDRAAIYRFNANWSGDFVVESFTEGGCPLVGVTPTVKDTHLMESQGGRYAKGETFAIADIHEAGHSACHIELLEQFQARAYAVAPIFQDFQLWGLVVVYQNAQPRPWQADEVELLAQVGEQLGIALHQQLEQKKKINRQKALVKIVGKVRQSLNFSEICQTTTHEARKVLKADRVAIYKFNPDWSGQFISESVAEPWVSVLEIQETSPIIQSNINTCTVQKLTKINTDTHLQETQGGSFTKDNIHRVCSDIYNSNLSDCHIETLATYQVRAYAIVAIYINDQYWGLFAAYQNSKPRHWKDDEIQLLVQVGEQLGIALQQSKFVQTIQEQTQELNQAFEELKQSQVQLIQNEKMASLGQLVAGTAHEINNPVNFIYGNLSHVEDYISDLTSLIQTYQKAVKMSTSEMHSIHEKTEDIELDFLLEDLPKTLKSMRIGTNRIRDIVLSLRNFSRLDEADIKAVDIHEGIDSTLLILSNRVRHCGNRDIPVTVIKDYGDIPQLECYPAQLNQVFMNILANALDALDETFSIGQSAIKTLEKLGSPCLWITTQAQGNQQIEVRIRDNGTGMTPDTVTRIFDHFFTTKGIGKGTGLGLAISHQLVTEKHGGTIEVRSTLGEGTEFKIMLPLYANRAT